MLFHPAHHYYGVGDWLWSIFSTALFIGLIVMAIALLVRAFSGPRQSGAGTAGRPGAGPPWFGPGSASQPGARQGSTTGTDPSSAAPVWRTPEAEGAERILAERYARGEISEDEYRSRLEVLRQAASGWIPQGPRPEPTPPSAAQSETQPPPPSPLAPPRSPPGSQQSESEEAR